MPANLTPQYKEAEQRYRQARGHEEKLAALREMLALLPKHKGTEKLQADLRHRVSKLEEEARGGTRSAAHRRDPGHVPREGAGQWVLIGAPNAGKSALLKALTHAHPEVAPYPFTTRVPQPGMMPFEDVQVQLVDTPALAPRHTEPYLTNLARNADGVALVVDVLSDSPETDVAIGLEFLERARIRPRARAAPPEAPPFLVERPVLVLGNKLDLDAGGEFLALLRETVAADLPVLGVSAERGAGLEELRERLFRLLGRIRVYAKEPGKKPDLERPFVLHGGATVSDLARAVHKEVADRLRYARLWGHARFEGQQVDREHALSDRDVVELHA
jgi:hypothetical protein